jgi:hypothetical protein
MAANRARAVAPLARFDPLSDLFGLVRDHPLQLRLIGLIGDNRSVQFVLAFARFGRENVAGECVLPNHFPRPGFFEPFGRTFMCL